MIIFNILINIRDRCKAADRIRLNYTVFPKWSLKQIDRDLAKAAAEIKSWFMDEDDRPAKEWPG